MSSIASLMTLVNALSLDDKLQLNAQLAALMAGAPLPAAMAAKDSAKTSSRKGKPAAPGTKAWPAFVEHCRTTMPERFAPPALPKDRMVIAKAIKDEDPEAYKAFADKYIAEHPASEAASVASASDAEESASAAAAKAEKPKRVISDEQKAKMKAGREAAAAAKAAAKAAGQPMPAKTKTKGKAKPAAAPQVGGGGSAPAAAAPKAAAPVVVDTSRVKITIEEVEYFMDSETFNLFAVEADGSEGAYAGRYNSEDDTIDLTVGEDE
jgi:histone H1/5